MSHFIFFYIADLLAGLGQAFGGRSWSWNLFRDTAGQLQDLQRNAARDLPLRAISGTALPGLQAPRVELAVGQPDPGPDLGRCLARTHIHSIYIITRIYSTLSR